MGFAENQRQRTMYWSRSAGWTPDEVSDSEFQLVAAAVTEESSDVHNELRVREERGGWNPLSLDEEVRLPGVKRGLVFTCKPRRGDTQDFMEVVSFRFIDREMVTELLHGLHVFSVDLEPMANPEMAIDRFCIPLMEAATFTERVTALQGVVQEAQADLQAMHSQLVKLSELAEELKRLCAVSRGVIDKVAEGIQSEAPSINERSVTTHLIKEQAVEMVTQIRDELLTLEQKPGQVDQKAWAQACAQRAEEFLTLIAELHKEHKSYEVQAITRLEETFAKGLPSAEAPAVTRRVLLLPVVEFYTELGFDCRLTEQGMIAQAEDGTVVELTDRIRIVGADSGQAQSAERVLLGNRSAERTQRQL